MIIATLFVNPIVISSHTALWLLLPLCLSVAVIYKTIRTGNVNRLGIQVAALFGYMVGGLVLLGGMLWLTQVIFL